MIDCKRLPILDRNLYVDISFLIFADCGTYEIYSNKNSVNGQLLSSPIPWYHIHGEYNKAHLHDPKLHYY